MNNIFLLKTQRKPMEETELDSFKDEAFNYYIGHDNETKVRRLLQVKLEGGIYTSESYV